MIGIDPVTVFAYETDPDHDDGPIGTGTFVA